MTGNSENDTFYNILSECIPATDINDVQPVDLPVQTHYNKLDRKIFPEGNILFAEAVLVK